MQENENEKKEEPAKPAPEQTEEPAPKTPAIDLTGVNKKALLEAMLFIEDKPMPLDKLAVSLQLEGIRELRALVEELEKDYENRGSGLQINEIAGGYQISTRSELGKYLKFFYLQKNKPKFSKSAIETLAIIAYKQPITRLEIEEIRGAGIGNSLKVLLERKLIRIDGRKNVVGHPLLYSTTKDFLIYFGLKSLDALPTIKEIREMEIQ